MATRFWLPKTYHFLHYHYLLEKEEKKTKKPVFRMTFPVSLASGWKLTRLISLRMKVLNLFLDGRKPTIENDTWRCQFIHIPVINQTHLWLNNHLSTNKLSNKQQKNSNWHLQNDNVFSMSLYRIDQLVDFLGKLATLKIS